MTSWQLESTGGTAIRTQVPELGRLRIEIFRDWPYLYEGTLDYERHYFETYARCPDSLVVTARADGKAIGATTALPLSAAAADMQAPFIAVGWSLEETLYFGESVVQKAWRGQGLGVAFFEAREVHARRLGLRHCVFCAVERPADHPARPPGYIGNEAFWSHRGYRRQPHLHCTFDWCDVGETQPSTHTMTFWLKTF